MPTAAALAARPTMDRPAHWTRAAVGFRLVDGASPVAIIIPTRPRRDNGSARWIADRIDAAPGGQPFRTLADAVAWCEAATWYGPIRDRMAATAARQSQPAN